MAKQSSFIKLEGTIGDVTFYKGKNGFHARLKGGVSKERILTDEKFRRTRENLAEFNKAALSAKLLKDAFGEITLRSRDTRAHNRIYSQALKIIRTDQVSNRGEREIQNGDLSLFRDFQFTYNAMFESTIYAQYGIQNDPTEILVQFQTFNPVKHIIHPKGATHFRMFLVSAGVDFVLGTHGSGSMVSPEFELQENSISNLVLTIPKATQLGPHQFYAIGVEFLQLVNGKMYDINNKAHNAAKIILVESL